MFGHRSVEAITALQSAIAIADVDTFFPILHARLGRSKRAMFDKVLEADFVKMTTVEQVRTNRYNVRHACRFVVFV